jgi:hypothetical protein
MPRSRLLVGATAVALVLAATPSSAVASTPVVRFPADAGLINVKAAPYSAKGDGVHDDTAAIRRAIRANIGSHLNIIYFPEGTYLVSDRIDGKTIGGRWDAYLTLQGAGEQSTVIKLKDHAAGYADPRAPKAVVYTASQPLAPGKDPYGGGKNWPARGEGNEAYRNGLADLTIDTGRGNPGAIGIDYLANNSGHIKHVTVRSGDGRGAAGVSMTRKWSGPHFIEHVTVKGFDYGLDMAQNFYGMTLEHLTLEGQKIAGIRNVDQQVYLRDVRSTNSVPAILHQGRLGFLIVLNGIFRGGLPAGSAIQATSAMMLRNVEEQGYVSVVSFNGQTVPGHSLQHYVSTPALSLSPTSALYLNLPVREAPEFHDQDMHNWANVLDYGATPMVSADSSVAIQAAIDSGKSTVYLPPGRYALKYPLIVRGGVKRIIGMFATLYPERAHALGTGAAVKIQNLASDFVVIERLNFSKNYWDAPFPLFKAVIEHSSPQAVVLRGIVGNGYRSLPGAGDIFAENVCCGTVEINGNNLWARQLNIESRGPQLVNNGGDVWVLGYKTEGPYTVLKTTGGGRTEVIGGSFYPIATVAPTTPLIINRESQQSVSYVDRGDHPYAIQIEETRNGIRRILPRTRTHQAGGGIIRIVPLFNGT